MSWFRRQPLVRIALWIARTIWRMLRWEDSRRTLLLFATWGGGWMLLVSGYIAGQLRGGWTWLVAIGGAVTIAAMISLMKAYVIARQIPACQIFLTRTDPADRGFWVSIVRDETQISRPDLVFALVGAFPELALAEVEGGNTCDVCTHLIVKHSLARLETAGQVALVPACTECLSGFCTKV